jgi:hypothetical protein
MLGLLIAYSTSQATEAATSQAYASHVSYTLQIGPRNKPEIVISNPGDGTLSNVSILRPLCPGATVCASTTKVPSLLGLPGVPPCDRETLRLSQLELPADQAENDILRSTLFFTDPAGRTWGMSAATGQLSQDGPAPGYFTTNPFAAQSVLAHIPGCV